MSLLRLTPHHCPWSDSICFGLHARKEQLAGDTTERGVSHCKARLLDCNHWTLPLPAHRYWCVSEAGEQSPVWRLPVIASPPVIQQRWMSHRQALYIRTTSPSHSLMSVVCLSSRTRSLSFSSSSATSTSRVSSTHTT